MISAASATSGITDGCGIIAFDAFSTANRFPLRRKTLWRAGTDMRTAIVNIGCIVSGDWHRPFVDGDTILMEDGRIVAAGSVGASEVESADVVIDADKTTAIPGLIDSHVHITFGDYTPDRKSTRLNSSHVAIS